MERLFKEISYVVVAKDIWFGFNGVIRMSLEIIPETYTAGTYSSVEFDHAYIRERHRLHHDVAGVYHTHPPLASKHPSHIDHITSMEWSKSLGKPFLLMIKCRGDLAAYYFSHETNRAISVPLVQQKDWKNPIVWFRDHTYDKLTVIPT